MNQVDKQYIELIKHILANGSKKEDRTGTGTLSVFDYTLRFNLNDGFPLLTTKKLHFKSIAIELLWMVSGSTNVKFLNDNNVTIWDSWVDENGELGPVYGKQWREWDHIQHFSGINQSKKTSNDYEFEMVHQYKCVDQITELIDQIKNNPDSRRLMVSAWNVGEIDKMALPPCHYVMQFYVNDNKLSCKFNMRSSDVFLGLPYNIASYALLTHIIAQQCDLQVGELIYSGGDVHIYTNHLEQVNEQIERKPYDLPTLFINNKPSSIFDYKFEDFEILNYQAHPTIKGKVAV